MMFLAYAFALTLSITICLNAPDNPTSNTTTYCQWRNCISSCTHWLRWSFDETKRYSMNNVYYLARGITISIVT